MTTPAARTPEPEPAHGQSGARVAQGIRDAILNGDLAPGERLRQEDLAARFGASRVPVREALRTLAAEGLVTLVANSGAWVAKLTAAEVTELYEIRERIEPLLLQYSIARLSSETVDQLEELAEQMEQAPDADAFIELDRRFHLLSYSAADTLVLESMATELWNRTQHYRRQFVASSRDDGDRRADLDHRLMIAAMRSNDAQEASSVLAMHIRRTLRELDRLPGVFE